MTRFTILIADDDVTQHEVLGEYLERAGFDVVHAYDGMQALDVAQGQALDLVCLDIRMPGMDGFQVIKKLQEHLPDLPVLFLSSLDAAHVKVRGLELGADDYIVKPFKKAEVLARVRAALRRSAKYRRFQKEMSGDLSQMGIAEILQAMDLGRKTCHVHIENGPGGLTFKDGMLASVRWRDLKGEEALQRLILLDEGRFSIDFTEVEDSGTTPVNSILMEALVAQDEALALLKDWTSLDDRLTMSPDITSEWTGQNVPETLRGLLLLLPGDLRKAATQISSWSRQGLVRPLTSDQGEDS